MKTAAFLVLGLLAATPAFAQDHSTMDHNQHAMTADTSAASTAYMDAMIRMDARMKAMKMTGKPGADFALMMIPHHQAAIDMAKAYLASGDSDHNLEKLSNEIIAAQTKEIAFLQNWLAKNRE